MSKLTLREQVAKLEEQLFNAIQNLLREGMERDTAQALVRRLERECDDLRSQVQMWKLVVRAGDDVVPKTDRDYWRARYEAVEKQFLNLNSHYSTALKELGKAERAGMRKEIHFGTPVWIGPPAYVKLRDSGSEDAAVGNEAATCHSVSERCSPEPGDSQGEPAAGEAGIIKCDYGDECPGHASPLDRPCGWEPEGEDQ